MIWETSWQEIGRKDQVLLFSLILFTWKKVFWIEIIEKARSKKPAWLLSFVGRVMLPEEHIVSHLSVCCNALSVDIRLRCKSYQVRFSVLARIFMLAILFNFLLCFNFFVQNTLFVIKFCSVKSIKYTSHTAKIVTD